MHNDARGEEKKEEENVHYQTIMTTMYRSCALLFTVSMRADENRCGGRFGGVREASVGRDPRGTHPYRCLRSTGTPASWFSAAKAFTVLTYSRYDLGSSLSS
jgi:hypothetical protein